MKRKFLVITTVLTLLVGVSGPTTTLACGESLYRVGHGLRYKVPNAPLPANVLIYSTSKGQKEIISKLIEAGHAVKIVSDLPQLTEAIGSEQFDIVIAPLSEKDAAEAGSASFVPLAANREEQRLANNEFHRSLRVTDDLLDYLKTIHYAMEDRIKT